MKNCGYDNLRKWLAQHHMGPNGQAYPTSSNDLVEMMNSGPFQTDSFKPRSKRFNRNKKNKKKEEKDEEIVGAIVEPIPNTPTTDEPDPAEDEVPDSDNDESIDNNLDALSKGDNSSEEDNIEADMRCVFAFIDSGLNEDNTRFDPKAEEEKYCDECDKALN